MEPELMDRLIRATKDSDQRELQALTALGPDNLEEDDDLIQTEYEEDEEVWNSYLKISNWLDMSPPSWILVYYVFIVTFCHINQGV